MHQLILGASGSTIKFLTKQMLEGIKVSIPNKEIMGRFFDYSEGYQRKIENLKQQIWIAQEARDRLLPKLMSGEITI